MAQDELVTVRRRRFCVGGRAKGASRPAVRGDPALPHYRCQQLTWYLGKRYERLFDLSRSRVGEVLSDLRKGFEVEEALFRL